MIMAIQRTSNQRPTRMLGFLQVQETWPPSQARRNSILGRGTIGRLSQATFQLGHKSFRLISQAAFWLDHESFGLCQNTCPTSGAAHRAAKPVALLGKSQTRPKALLAHANAWPSHLAGTRQAGCFDRPCSVLSLGQLDCWPMSTCQFGACANQYGLLIDSLGHMPYWLSPKLGNMLDWLSAPAICYLPRVLA